MNKVIFYLAILSLLLGKVEVIGQLAPCTEKVYVQTDRDVYVAGEELFFTCLRFDSETSKNWTSSKFAYLVLRNGKNSLISGTCLKLDENRFSGSLYLPDTLSTGWYQLVSYTNYMRNSGESAYFTKEILIANRFDKDLSGMYFNLPADTLHQQQDSGLHENIANGTVSITSEKKVYSKREKIKVTLAALGLKDDGLARVSISVHDLTPSTVNNRLNHETILSNQQGSHGSTTVCHYLPEIKGIVLAGRALNDDNQPISETCVYLSSPDSVSNLQFTQTNKNGEFQFLLNEYYNDKKLILTLPDMAKGRIELDNKYELKEPYQPSGLYPDTRLKDYLVKSQNIVQVQKTYHLEMVKIHPEKVGADYSIPWAYPPVNDAVYPADFVSLPDFVEISREILPLLKTRKHGDSYDAHILDLDKMQFLDRNPLIFLDGVPINNINQIIGLSTKNINKIETLGAERYDGGRLYSGILAVFSKDNAINNIAWKSPMLVVKYEQLHIPSVYAEPVLPKTGKQPDFRQLLYWEPSVVLRANDKKVIEFQASDNTGEYEITAEGVTSEGRLIKTKTIINVAFRSN